METVITSACTRPGTATIMITGELDLAQRDGLLRAIADALSEPGSLTVIVDLKDVTFIDASAIGALVRGYRAAHMSGRSLRVANASGIVLQVFVIGGVASLLAADPAPGGLDASATAGAANHPVRWHVP